MSNNNFPLADEKRRLQNATASSAFAQSAITVSHFFPEHDRNKRRLLEREREKESICESRGGPFRRGARGTRAAKEDTARHAARARYSQERKPATEVTPPRGRAPGRRVASPVGSPGNEKQDFMGLHRTVSARRGYVQDRLKARLNENRDAAMRVGCPSEDGRLIYILFNEILK